MPATWMRLCKYSVRGKAELGRRFFIVHESQSRVTILQPCLEKFVIPAPPSRRRRPRMFTTIVPRHDGRKKRIITNRLLRTLLPKEWYSTGSSCDGGEALLETPLVEQALVLRGQRQFCREETRRSALFVPRIIEHKLFREHHGRLKHDKEYDRHITGSC